MKMLPPGGAVRTWTVSYDIGSGHRRRRVADLLGRAGQRRQLSVFTVHGTATQLTALVDRSALLLDGPDHLLAVPFCSRCQALTAGVDLEPVPALWVSR